MFAFFVLMLFLAALTDNKPEVNIKDKMVESELATENQLTNETLSYDVIKN